MDSVSRSSCVDEEFGRIQLYSQRAELPVNVDGRGSEPKPGTPTTPRSKHSATEQRRRCKINDRFQILRDLIPHRDQKRDKASFLLEVIEYIKFLQEKVQKYEAYPGWNQENEKLLWSNHQGATALSNQNVVEADMSAGTTAVLAPMESNYYASDGRISGLCHSQERLITDSDNLVSHSQSEWQRSSGAADCTASSDVMNEQEELTIDEGTISFSRVYSQGLLAALTQAVENSGVDLSQASISVQINIGKRAVRRPNHPSTTLVTMKDPDRQVMGKTRVGCNGVESEQDLKRQRVANS